MANVSPEPHWQACFLHKRKFHYSGSPAVGYILPHHPHCYFAFSSLISKTQLNAFNISHCTPPLFYIICRLYMRSRFLNQKEAVLNPISLFSHEIPPFPQ